MIDEVGCTHLLGWLLLSPSTFMAAIFVRQLCAVFCWNLTHIYRSCSYRGPGSSEPRIHVSLKYEPHGEGWNTQNRAYRWIPGRLIATMVPQRFFRGTLIQIKVVDSSIIPGRDCQLSRISLHSYMLMLLVSSYP